MLAPVVPPIFSDQVFRKPADWVALLLGYREGIRRKTSDLEELNLRKPWQKPIREIWHASIFGIGYEVVHGFSGLSIRHHGVEASDIDVEFLIPPRQSPLPVQLKEQPPKGKLSPKHLKKTELEPMIEKVTKQHGSASELMISLYLNRTEKIEKKVYLPDVGAGFWLWAWSKEDHSEIFLAGGSNSTGRVHRVALKFILPPIS